MGKSASKSVQMGWNGVGIGRELDERGRVCFNVRHVLRSLRVWPLVQRKLPGTADFIILLLRIWALTRLKDEQEKVKDRSGCLANMEKRPTIATKDKDAIVSESTHD
ncbi:hypothetical protein D4764_01G0006490 [Takifugu flavidus]|uniref:Uncharacterized protein n=1 Tax=Takifugu flavidus TaxID=433684 RepID=A0A5C6PM96_9TELE|nr:hypothetical protein D4764_01G0006490 [Takifugu flavidus]